MPWCTKPSRFMRSPTPLCASRSTVPCSSTPARMVASISSRLRDSTTIEAMPSRCRRCESSRPAGPAPTIATWVFIPSAQFEAYPQHLLALHFAHHEHGVAERSAVADHHPAVGAPVQVLGQGLVGMLSWHFDAVHRRQIAQHRVAVEDEVAEV